MRSIVRGLGLVALLGLVADGACTPSFPLAPWPGAWQYLAPAFVAVPGGEVDTAGGNLLVRRADLSIDTRLGTQLVGAAYNSTTGSWLWSFDVSYDGATFVDESGASHWVGALPDGAPVPGTIWTRLDATHVATRGGLVYGFDAATHRLLGIRRRSAALPELRFVQQQDAAGAWRTDRVDQCSAAGCALVYDIDYAGSGTAARVVSIADRAGRRASFSWDAGGRLVAARDALAVARGWAGFRYEYAGGLLRAITNAEGERVEFGYEEPAIGSRNRLLAVTQIGAGDPSWRFAYLAADANGIYRTDLSDPLGGVTSWRYDAQGRVVSICNPEHEITSIEWAGLRPGRVVAPDGTATSFSWSDDLLASWTPPAGGAIRVAYQPDGESRGDPGAPPIASVQDALGLLQQRSYDAQGRLVAIANGAGETRRFAYSSDNEIASATDPGGVVTGFGDYGEHGHPATATRAGVTSAFAYDAVGNLLGGPELALDSGPGLGGVVSRSFDEDRNVRALELADLPALFPQSSQTLSIEWRSDHRRTRIARPGGGDTELVYDALGRLAERRERADGTWRSTGYAHDALGRTTALARPNGMGETWSYDAAGRVTLHQILRDGAVENAARFTWQDGRVASLLDAAQGGTESYAYDASGRVAEIRYAGGERMQLGYDARSRLVQAQLWSAGGGLLRVLGLGYDAAGRETSLLDGAAVLVARSYAGGRLAQTRYGNGLVRGYAYDAALGALAGTTLAPPSGPPVETTAVQALDPNCPLARRCLSASTATPGAASFEKYWLSPPEGGGAPLDQAGLRVGAAWERGDALVLGYDALSNLVLGGAGTLDYNAERNRLLRIEAGPDYAWDAAGFATRRGDVAIGWDGAGRIAAVGDARFVWDALGRPVSRRSAGVETRFRFGGLVEADAAGAPLAIELGEVRVELAAGGALYRHFDFRGNVKLTTDAAGRVLAHYQYGAYGVDQLFGATSDPLRFARGRAVGELFVIGRRLYDPLAARFLAPDPIHQLVNQYAYTLGNPVEMWDPWGAESAAVDVAVAAAGIAGGRIGQAAGAAAGAQWGAAIGGLLGGPPGAGAGAAIGAGVGSVVGGAYFGAAFANLTSEAITGEQLLGLRLFPPDGGAPLGNGGSAGDVPGPSTGGAADADRGWPVPGTHPCNGDACGGGVGDGGLTHVATLGGGGYGCAPVTLGRVGDSRLPAALLVANCALGAIVWSTPRRRRA